MIAPALEVGKANVMASFGKYLETHIPEERWVFDELTEPIFDSPNVSAAIGVEEIPLAYGNDRSGFGGTLSDGAVQGSWEETQFSLEIVVDRTKEPNASLRARLIRDKIVYLLRSAARMDDSGPSQLQIKPPIWVYNFAADAKVDTTDTANIVGQVFIPWMEDGWLQEFRETDPEHSHLKRYRLVVRAGYWTRFDQTFTPTSVKPS